MTTTVDWKTPSVTAIDARGLAVRQMIYLRNVPGGTVQTLITRQCFDNLGRLMEQRDARLLNAAKPNLATIYDLGGQPVNVASVDAGGRTRLVGLAGEILLRWDGRGNHWRNTYDNQLRMLTLEESGQGIVDAYAYATALADPSHNLRGQMIRQTDLSGVLELNSFNLKGQPLRDSRTITDAGTFTSSRTYNPHGALLTQTDAGEHQQRMHYDIAGQLRQVQLRLEPTGTWQAVLEEARYNAEGQIIEQQAGNKVLSTWVYDEADGRLTAFTAGVPGQATLQHFAYLYDRVGNTLRIDDLTFKPMYFANQQIDGRREFTYNSLYQLSSATGHDALPSADLPGRPSPSDPNNHLNYTQRYEYNAGGSLIKLIHERAVGGYSHEMLIDPTSNRGVRWKEADPVPDFDTLFDRHGNQQVSSPGRSLHWNSRDQLVSATLVERENSASDEETYRYSQDLRLLKRHEWQASNITHFRQVIYLPGLEIRTRDDGETLHVITLPGGRGNVRCLHWASKKPDGIDQNQLRYTLDDQLGSCLMELDQDARQISHEGYYPFGGTAWLKAVSLLEVGYKTIRYSGKEMDECGLYYYGARYYAPWLQRWVSTDPTGAADGLNLYQFVGNNPLRYVDQAGEAKAENVILNYSNFISVLEGHASQTLGQIDNIIHKSNIATSLAKNLLGESINAAIGFSGGFYAGENLGGFVPQHTAAGSLNAKEVMPYSGGLVVGNFGGEMAGRTSPSVIPVYKLTGPLIPQTSTMSIKAIDQGLGLDTGSNSIDWLGSAISRFFNNVVGSVVPGVGAFLAMGSRVQEAEDIKNGLDPVKIGKIEAMLNEWESVENKRYAYVLAAFKGIGTDVIYPADVLPNVNYMTPKSRLQPIRLSDLKQQHAKTQDLIRRNKAGLAQIKERGTTDNRFLLKQARTGAKHHAHA
ncbi:RHS repeat-associated core domain-containing protein [Pseudomonas sp. A-B-26]|uniref:RHS repeat-associated core domain-containing protein n=1 Tax=Pseudomonas sp. A-B-26 TaxID=2832406 RepID=UPI001CBD2D01|nr:RHS repeat-associated core domain-containing protein [Pseudomonas sp. A-B-26]